MTWSENAALPHGTDSPPSHAPSPAVLWVISLLSQTSAALIVLTSSCRNSRSTNTVEQVQHGAAASDQCITWTSRRPAYGSEKVTPRVAARCWRTACGRRAGARLCRPTPTTKRTTRCRRPRAWCRQGLHRSEQCQTCTGFARKLLRPRGSQHAVESSDAGGVHAVTPPVSMCADVAATRQHLTSFAPVPLPRNPKHTAPGSARHRRVRLLPRRADHAGRSAHPPRRWQSVQSHGCGT